MAYTPENTPPMTPEQQQASAVLQRIIANNPMVHGDPTHPQFLNNAKVELSTQFSQGASNAKLAEETLDIIITDPHAEMSPKAVGNFVVEQLQKIPGLKDRIHFNTVKEEQKELSNTLEKLINAGAPIPPEFKDWPGFNENNGQVEKHAVSVQRSDGGVFMELRVPKKAKMSVQQVADDLQKRLPQIKEVLAERLSKYTAGDTQKNKVAILAKLNTMEFSTSVNEHEWWNQVSISMKSPEQVAALKQTGGVEAVADKAALRATNILNSVSESDEKPELQKALARAVFTAGNPSPAVLAAVLGRDDMNVYFTKTLKPFTASKPDMAKDVEKLLNSDTLKENSWRSDDEPKPDKKGSFRISKGDKDQGRIYISLNLPVDYSALQAIKDIAGLDPMLAATAAQATPGFAHVDHVQLIAASSPQTYQYAQEVLSKAQIQAQAPQAPVQAPVQASVEQQIMPRAEKVLALVEQAHNEIVEATREATTMFAQDQQAKSWVARTQQQPTPAGVSTPTLSA